MTFACITPALIVGGFAERMKFSAVILFVILWVTLVYFPIAHMAWDVNGLYFKWGAKDFAGGTVVHINAGIAALVGAMLIGPRIGHRKEIMPPHSMTLTMVGASILWVGWFGFNAGSALTAGGGAALAMMNTFVATAGAIVSWSAIEAVFRGKASMLGAASGMVAGLVAVTPAAGFVGPLGAIVLGVIAAAGCYFFVQVVKERFGYDDSLDVFGVHGIGGIVGAVGTGFLASTAFGGTGYADGVSMGGAGRDPDQGSRRDHPLVRRRVLRPLQAGRHGRGPACGAGDRARGARPRRARRARLRLLTRNGGRPPASAVSFSPLLPDLASGR